MAGLQVLEDKYGPQGFHVLGFYSNDFGNQGGTDDQINECTAMGGVCGSEECSFPQFEIAEVIEPNAQPVWHWLLAQPNPETYALPPSWNFHKYLISRDGQLIHHYLQADYMGNDATAPEWEANDIVQGIEAELAK